jgi:hypothetical protein
MKSYMPNYPQSEANRPLRKVLPYFPSPSSERKPAEYNAYLSKSSVISPFPLPSIFLSVLQHNYSDQIKTLMYVLNLVVGNEF